jgi:retinol dehydrogenase-12
VGAKLRRKVPWPLSLIEDIIAWPLSRSTEVGARTLVHAALWGTKGEVNGKFLNNSRVEEESDFSLSEEGRELETRVWVRELSFFWLHDLG